MQRPSIWTAERILLVVVLVTTAIYWRDLSYDFLLDDVSLILMSTGLASWRNLPAIFRTDIFHFSSPVHTAVGAIHYRPVYMTWLLLNARLFGFVLPWWHVMSLVLHATVTLLVYRMGVRMLNDKWVAALAGSLFALHPIHTEPVAYVTACDDLMVALFLLVALLFYFRFREDGGRRYHLIVSVASAAAAMFSKESAGIFPWVLVAYEALKQQSTNKMEGWKKYVWTLPYFVIGAAYVVIRTALFGSNAGPGPGTSRAAALLDIPLAMLVYTKNLFLPIQLSFLYPPEWSSQWTVAKAVGVLLVVTAVVLIWRWYKQRPEVRTLLAWMGIMLIPPALALTTFAPDHWVHDRHMYLASVPLCLLLAVLIAEAVRRRHVLAIVSAGIVGLLAVDTWFQVPRFQDEISIYSSAEKVAPRNVNLHRYFASALFQYNRHEQALEELRKVIELRPNSPAAHYEYGCALAQTARKATAIDEFRKALALAPPAWQDRADLLYQIALLEIASSELDAADTHIREAITMAPQTLNYHATLAEVLAKKGDSTQADQELQIETANRKRFLNRHTE